MTTAKIRPLSAEEKSLVESLVEGASLDRNSVVLLSTKSGHYRSETRTVEKLLTKDGFDVQWQDKSDASFYETRSGDWIAPALFVLNDVSVPVILGVLSSYLSAKMMGLSSAVHVRVLSPTKAYEYKGPLHGVREHDEARIRISSPSKKYAYDGPHTGIDAFVEVIRAEKGGEGKQHGRQKTETKTEENADAKTETETETETPNS